MKNDIYTLKIEYDEFAESPRQWDNFGKIIGFHSRYNLGDEHSYNSKDDFIISLVENITGDYEEAENIINKLGDKLDKTSRFFERNLDNSILKYLSEKIAILPVYIYDHSGIAINTTGFNCSWDSGQVGFTYADEDAIINEYGECNNETIQKAIELLEGEISIYNDYIQGNTYSYSLLKNGEEIESCSGYIGDLEEVKKQICSELPEDLREILNFEMEAMFDFEEYEMEV